MKKRRKAGSRRWLREHFDDEFVKRAQKEGWRSRAIYKLQEIDQRDRVLQPGMTVLDLGAAPGGWSQWAVQRVGPKGQVIALDRLPMEPVPGVEFLEGDFREESVLERLLELLGDREVDLVMSDMAPNISGVDAIDQPRSIYLVELALDCAERVLRPGGDLLVKAFQGAGHDELVTRLRAGFRRVQFRKPKASRARSSEVYLLARQRLL